MKTYLLKIKVPKPKFKAALYLICCLFIANHSIASTVSFTDGLSRQLSTSNQVGSIPGNYSVSPTGSAQYSFPIQTPPGINGLTPSLGISYSSNAGNGLLGWGWNLSGLMSITRGSTSRLQEGYINGVTQTTSDRFYFNGSRMICVSGSYGVVNSQYRLEDDQNILIKYLSGANGYFFEVHMPNGTVCSLGETSSARITGTATISWYLNEVRDFYGNTILYNYTNISGEVLLNNITYAGNTIQLHYETRANDANTSYVYGTAIYHKNILKDVEVSVGIELQYKYAFEYSEDLYKLLNVIRMYGQDGKQVNPTIVNWSNNTVSSQHHSISSSLQEIKYYGDFNGDGRTDIISIPENYETSTGLVKVSICNSSGIGFSDSDISFGEGFGGVTIGDFNNDGKDEMYLLFETDEVLAGTHPPQMVYRSRFKYYYYSSSQNKLIASSSSDKVYSPSYGHKLKMLAADFNSDGQIDYLLYNLTSNSFFKKSFSSSGGNLTTTPTFNFSEARIIDFNGNGVPNLLCDSDVYEYRKSTGKFEVIKYNIPAISFQYGAQSGDLNGDGKTDFFNIGPNYEYSIYYSDGKSLVQKPAPFSAFTSPDVDGPYESIRLMDFNGDGKMDILRLYFETTKVTLEEGWNVTPKLKGYIYYSTGDNFVSKNISSLFSAYQFDTRFYVKKPRDPDLSVDIANDFSSYEIFISHEPNVFPQVDLLDFDGDGNGDLIVKKPNVSSSPYEVVTINPNQRDRLVTMVTNGLNVNTKFEYATLNDNTVYSTSGTSYSFPTVRFKAPVYVVKKLSVLNDGTYFSSNDYDYTDAIRHKEYGFLGFGKFSIHQQPQNIISETTFESLGARYALVPKTSTTKLGTGSLIATSTSVNQETSTSIISPSRYYQSRITSTTTTDHLKGFTKTTSYNDFNTYNNPKEIVEAYGSDMTVTIGVVYNPLTDPYWMPNRMSSSTRTQKHKDDAASYAVTTSYAYETGSPFQLKDKTLFSGTPKNVKETYTYHPKGGIASVSSKAADVATARLTSFVYYPDGKFIQKRKASDQIWEEYTYDAMGRVKTKKDQDGLTTSIDYDEFGNHQTSTFPNGNTLSSSLDFTSTGPAGSLFYSQSQQTGQGYVKKYFNALGQLLRTESPGFNQTVLKKDQSYDSSGRLYKEYLPYSVAAGSYAQYAYDAYGRLLTITLPNSQGDKTYLYTGNTTKVTSPSGWSEVTEDASGLVAQANDAGGTINKTFFSNGLPKTHAYGTNSLSFTYDIQGNRLTSYSPNTGTTTSTYNAFGELKTQVDARGVTYSMQYDNLGRMTDKLVGGANETHWNYSTNGLLSSVDGADVDISYSYDSYKRIDGITETINGQTFTTGYEFNTNGQVSKVTYPGSFVTNQIYDSNGILTEVKRNDNNTSIWLLQNVTNHGAIEQFKYGNSLISNYTYDSKLRPQKIKSGTIFEWDYAFANNGNLSSRTNVKIGNQSQSFSYDALNRLTSYGGGSMTYESNGNIDTKPDVGNFNYNSGKPNAVSKITSPVSAYNPFHEIITYTDFQKVESITDQENNHRLEFTYGPDYGRRMMKTLESGSLKKTKYYSNGLYEKIVNDLGQSKEINYISGSSGLAAVFVKDFDNSQKMYYVHQDYLGSIMALSNENGSIAERYYFDAWGNRKDPNNWSQNDTRTSFILDRGFTGHEHLDHFDLINMNGRVYDAALGSFLSADPIIQAPHYTQDLNLYSYAYGNPLKYTDPSGYTEKGPPPPPSGDERKNSVKSHSNMLSMAWRIYYRTGPGFSDYTTYINGKWVKNSTLAGWAKSGDIVHFNSARTNILIGYLKAGFDISFQFNGTANYALAIDGGVTVGSAAGVIWNANYSDAGLHLGFNKGVNSFSKGNMDSGDMAKKLIEKTVPKISRLCGFNAPESVYYPIGNYDHDINYALSYQQAYNGEFPLNWLLTRFYLSNTETNFVQAATGASLGRRQGGYDRRRDLRNPNDPNQIDSWDDLHNEFYRWQNWNGY